MILKNGAIQQVHADGQKTAMLTVRGKDHDMTAAELRALAYACTESAKAIELTAVIKLMGRSS